MFNLKVLDVAIGTSFFFVFASLICSVVREALEGFFRTRPKLLEQGLHELLDENGDAPGDAVEAFYNHPLIDSLFYGPYAPNSSSLPSYIPAKHFSAALLDLVAPAGLALAQLPAAKAPAAADVAAAAVAAAKVAAEEVASAAVAPGAIEDANIAAARAAGADTAAAKVAAAAQAAADVATGAVGSASGAPADIAARLNDAKFRALLNAVLPSEPSASAAMLAAPEAAHAAAAAGAKRLSLTPGGQLERALRWALESSGGNMDKARQALESWYDNSMQRVSGWYKRETQAWLLGIGFVLAMLLNLNAVRVIERLYSDDELRTAIVADAQRATKDAEWAVRHGIEVGKAEPSPPAAATEPPAPDQAPPAAEAKPKDPDVKTEATAVRSRGGKGEPPKPQPPVAPAPSCPPAPPSSAPSCPPAAKSPAEVELAASALATLKSAKSGIDTTTAELAKLGYPIGWSAQDWKDFADTSTDQKLRFAAASVFGWLLTALATTLGAAFWFDIVNKLVSLRISLKPADDSQEKPKKSAEAANKA